MELKLIGTVRKVKVVCKTCHFARNDVEIHTEINTSRFAGKKGLEVVNHFVNNPKHLLLFEGITYAVEDKLLVRVD